MNIRQYVYDSVIESWYRRSGGWTRCLKPLSLLFSFFAERRKQHFLKTARWTPPVPVVVVGNISVGGTGKTPLVVAMVRELRNRGYQPGVISRGFGVESSGCSISVTSDSDPAKVGDEPVMIAQKLNVPLVVDVDRVRAAQYLCDHFDINVIITDDGLQHYNLRRHLEIVVLDGDRLLGNGLCFPAGPLREPPERINDVDMVLINSSDRSKPATTDVLSSKYKVFLQHQNLHCFFLEPSIPVSMVAPSAVVPETIRTVHGVAGIGNPERFFHSLELQGYHVVKHSFPDHHAFTSKDICFNDDLPVIMTEKDAVKCYHFADERHFFLPVFANLPGEFVKRLVAEVEAIKPLGLAITSSQ